MRHVAPDAPACQFAVARGAECQSRRDLEVVERASGASGTVGQPRAVLGGDLGGHAARPDEGGVRDLTRQAHHLRAPAADGDRYRCHWTDHAGRCHDEGRTTRLDLLARQQGADRGDRLAQGEDRPWVTHAERLEPSSHPETEERSAATGVLQRRRHAGQYCGMSGVGIGHHAAKLNRARALCDEAEQDEAVRPEDDVTDAEAIEADLFGEDGELDHFGRGHAGRDLRLDRQACHRRTVSPGPNQRLRRSTPDPGG